MDDSRPVEEMAFVVDSQQTFFMCALYMVVGGIAIICNLLNIVVFCSARDLRRKYIYFIALDIGELLNGACYIMAGTGRLNLLFNGELGNPITTEDCFFTKYWSIPLILGTELPALFTIVISSERVAAVKFPSIYRRFYGTSFKIISVVLVILFEIGSIALAALSANGNYEIQTTQHCAIISSTSILYSTSHFLFLVFAYVISFTTLVPVYITQMHLHISEERRKASKLKHLIFITAVSIVLVAAPSVAMIGVKWQLYQLSDFYVSITYAAPGLLSIATTLLNMTFRQEFRHYFLKLFCISDTYLHSITTTNHSHAVVFQHIHHDIHHHHKYSNHF